MAPWPQSRVRSFIQEIQRGMCNLFQTLHTHCSHHIMNRYQKPLRFWATSRSAQSMINLGRKDWKVVHLRLRVLALVVQVLASPALGGSPAAAVELRSHLPVEVPGVLVVAAVDLHRQTQTKYSSECNHSYQLWCCGLISRSQTIL